MSNAVSDVLKNAFLQSTISDETSIAVKAEDVQQGGGIDFSKHYFEPKPGSTYLIKFLPNPGGETVTHRSLYKDLPDPERRGKSFHYVGSGNAKTCKALDAFFQLNAKAKDGDAVAKKKIDEYLGRTNQACVKIQVLQSPVAEEIGIVRMFTFSSYGPNAALANLIDSKLNISKEKLAQGFTKEDIFNIFGSSVLSLVCEESVYENRKGRDYSKSAWVPNKTRGAIAKLADGTTHEFSKADLQADGNPIPTVVPFFNAFVEQVLSPDYDIHNYFAYKVVDDPKNTKETNDYLKKVMEKVDEIIPVILEKSLQEIASYGKAEAPSATGNAENSAKNIHAESLPDELKNSIMGNTVAATVNAVPAANVPEVAVEKPVAPGVSSTSSEDDELKEVLGAGN